MRRWPRIQLSLPGGARRACRVAARFVPHGSLPAIWLWLVFSSGGYVPRTWLLPAVIMALLALLLVTARICPYQTGQLSTMVTVLFCCYAVWVAVSASWADSLHRVWLEATRVFFLLAAFWTASLCFNNSAGQKAFRYLFLASNTCLLALCLIKLWSADSLSSTVAEVRLVYPVGYADNAAALFLVSFWPLLWLSAGPEEKAPVRGLALGIATGLLGLAVLTRSQGAAWSLALSAVFAFAVSPGRSRMLLHLFPLALAITYAFPRLEKHWEAVSSGSQAARALVTAAVVAAFCGMILALLETWIKVTWRMKTIFAAFVLVALVAGASYGLVVGTRDSGGPITWFQQKFETLTDKVSQGQQEQSGGQADNPWSVQNTPQERLALWEDTVSIFRQSPILGVGAGNFVFWYDRTAPRPGTEPDSPHSVALQILTETGIVGGILFFGSLLVVTVAVLRPRVAAARRRSGPESQEEVCPCTKDRWGNRPLEYGWPVALLSGVTYWFIHANFDWLWAMNAVTIPALFFVACALGHIDLQAGVLGPRVKNLFSHVKDWSPGLLARAFRVGLGAVACLVLVGAVLSYAATRWEDAALAVSPAEAPKAIKRADVARWLQPLSPEPHLVKGLIYEEQARLALENEASDMAGAVLDNLSLAISSYEKGASLEPTNWLAAYKAGAATLNLVAARAYLENAFAAPLTIDQSAAHILTDWSLLARANSPSPAGDSALSLANTASEISLAASYRAMRLLELLDQAKNWLDTAFYLRPAATQTSQALTILATLRQALR